MSAVVCRLLAAASIFACAGTALADRDRGHGGADRGRDNRAGQPQRDGRGDRGGPNDRGRSDGGRDDHRGGRSDWGSQDRDHNRGGGGLRIDARFVLGGFDYGYRPRTVLPYYRPVVRPICPAPVVIIDPCPPRPICPPPVVVVERPYEAVRVVTPVCEPPRIVVQERCEPARVVVEERRYETPPRRVPAYVIVQQGARDYGNLCSDLTIGGRRVKAVVSVRTVGDRISATARFVGDGCDLPDMDAVSIKIKGDGDIWTGALQSINPGRDRCEYAIDNIRWRGGESLQVELQVGERDSKQCVRWE